MSCLPWIRTALIGELYRRASSIGIPRLRDEASARPIHILGIDHPTPRTRRTGETILMVDRADAHYVTVGRLWTVDERRAVGSGLRTHRHRRAEERAMGRRLGAGSGPGSRGIFARGRRDGAPVVEPPPIRSDPVRGGRIEPACYRHTNLLWTSRTCLTYLMRHSRMSPKPMPMRGAYLTTVARKTRRLHASDSPMSPLNRPYESR